MLGDSWTAGAKVRGDLTDSEPIVTQESKDLSASGISDGTENCVFSPTSIGNHTVTNTVTIWLRMSRAWCNADEAGFEWETPGVASSYDP
jgi:hypothetical protein